MKIQSDGVMKRISTPYTFSIRIFPFVFFGFHEKAL
jgi:hypothetical protein